MEPSVLNNLQIVGWNLKEIISRKRFLNQVGRDQHLPMGEALGECSSPFPQASFARIDLLTTAHQGDDDGPAFVAIHNVEHDFGFGTIAFKLSLRVFRIPSPLSLVEDNHPVSRSRRVSEVSIDETMDILNER